jgi:hypothetical protein
MRWITFVIVYCAPFLIMAQGSNNAKNNVQFHLGTGGSITSTTNSFGNFTWGIKNLVNVGLAFNKKIMPYSYVIAGIEFHQYSRFCKYEVALNQFSNSYPLNEYAEGKSELKGTRQILPIIGFRRNFIIGEKAFQINCGAKAAFDLFTPYINESEIQYKTDPIGNTISPVFEFSRFQGVEKHGRNFRYFKNSIAPKYFISAETKMFSFQRKSLGFRLSYERMPSRIWGLDDGLAQMLIVTYGAPSKQRTPYVHLFGTHFSFVGISTVITL